jgi:hypothetical protein
MSSQTILRQVIWLVRAFAAIVLVDSGVHFFCAIKRRETSEFWVGMVLASWSLALVLMSLFWAAGIAIPKAEKLR